MSRCRIIINSFLLIGAFVFCLGYSSDADFHTPVNTPRATAESSDILKNFTKGDLLYGLQSYRDPYLKPILKKTGYEFCTVDRFNNKFTPQLMDNETFSTKKYLELRGKIENHEQKILDPQIAAYMITIMEDALIKNEVFEGMKNEDLIILLCVKAIDYTIERNHKIHFILDHIDIDKIFSKEYEKDGKGFTNAELKYIYHNWQQLQHGIIFYDNGRVVDAPWIKEPKLWEQLLEK